MFKVNNENLRTMCENSSKLTIKIPERRHWRRSRVFIINFEQIFFFFLSGFSSTNIHDLHGSRGGEMVSH